MYGCWPACIQCQPERQNRRQTYTSSEAKRAERVSDMRNPPRVGEVLGPTTVPHACQHRVGDPPRTVARGGQKRGGNCLSNPMSFDLVRRWTMEAWEGTEHLSDVRDGSATLSSREHGSRWRQAKA